MDERFIIDSVPMAPWPADAGKDLRVKTFKTVRASDALQHAKPFWHRYFGSISAELETILDGFFFHSGQDWAATSADLSAKSSILGD